MSTVLMNQLRGSLEAVDHPRRTGKYLICPGCGAIHYRAIRMLNRVFCNRECFNTHAKRLGLPIGRSIRRPAEERFWSKVRKTDGCWLWTGPIGKDGYGSFGVGGKNIAASRFAYKSHYKVELTPDQFVCHHCDNPPCVRPDHLFLGSNLANILDCVRKGRKPKGEDHCNAKLTATNILEIRASSLNSSALGEKFGVSRHHIWNIRKAGAWRHIS